MNPPERCEFIVIERLNADAQPVCSERKQCFDLWRVDRSGIRLDGYLNVRGEAVVVFQAREELSEAISGKEGRGAAPKIDRLQKAGKCFSSGTVLCITRQHRRVLLVRRKAQRRNRSRCIS